MVADTAEIPPFPHRPARGMATAMLAAGLVVGSLTGGVVGAELVDHHTAAAPAQSRITATSAATAATAPGTASAGSAPSLSAIYQQASPGVVTISTEVAGFAAPWGRRLARASWSTSRATS